MIPPLFAGPRAICAVELRARRRVSRGWHAHPGREPEALCGHHPVGRVLGAGPQGQVVPKRARDEGDGRGR